jgi:hypothetical protein
MFFHVFIHFWNKTEIAIWRQKSVKRDDKWSQEDAQRANGSQKGPKWSQGGAKRSQREPTLRLKFCTVEFKCIPQASCTGQHQTEKQLYFLNLLLFRKFGHAAYRGIVPFINSAKESFSRQSKPRIGHVRGGATSQNSTTQPFRNSGISGGQTLSEFYTIWEPKPFGIFGFSGGAPLTEFDVQPFPNRRFSGTERHTEFDTEFRAEFRPEFFLLPNQHNIDRKTILRRIRGGILRLRTAHRTRS